jgi:hypothetical protein
VLVARWGFQPLGRFCIALQKASQSRGLLPILDELIASGDLDPAIRGRLKTLDSAGAVSIWRKSTAGTGLANDTGPPGFGCNPF